MLEQQDELVIHNNIPLKRQSNWKLYPDTESTKSLLLSIYAVDKQHISIV
jgi:hypothetical protein